MVSILSSLGIALLSGGIKCLTEDTLSKAAFMTLDGLFSGPLGNLGQEGFDRIKEVLGGPKLLDKNEDIERCSRNALLNALIAFSEAAKKHVDSTGLSPDRKKDCLHFLEKAQKHFDTQLKALADLPADDPKLANKSLINGDLITRILASGQQERIEGLKNEFTKLALEEYTYPPQNVLYEPLSRWLSEGLPDDIKTHWFIYYIQAFHANLKKNVPVFCQNARRILTQKQLADLSLLTKENLERLDELMPLSEKILAVVSGISEQIRDIKTDTEEIKGDNKEIKNDIKEIKEYHTKPKYNLPVQLSDGSERYYQLLTGPNGPYHHLDISEAILAGMTPADPASKSSNPSLSATVKDNKGQGYTLGASLAARWGQEKPHILLLGDGGMGKTVSLIHLWKALLEKNQQDTRQPIPLFVSLKEYNTVPEIERHNFISSRIAWHYLRERKNSGETTNAFWDFIMEKPELDITRLVLLLDGFNEITLDASLRSPLLLELQEISQKANGVQMVLSSRHEMNFNWATGFQTMALQPLDSSRVERYLRQYGVSVPHDIQLQQVLQNPMMLTLYANSSEIVKQHKVNPQFDFKPRTTTQGELLWNYLEVQIVKLSDLLGVESPDFHFHKFIIQHFLPYIGYEMEKAGKFEVDKNVLKELVIEACEYFYKEEFTDAYPEYESYLDGFNLERLDFPEKGKRFERISELICRKLNMMKQKQKSYEFIHQNFRDYFAAVHILNELHRDINNESLPQILKYRTFSLTIRRFMGEIEGEAYQCEDDIPSATVLMQALDAFRNLFETDVIGYSVWNIVNVWKVARQHLGGADFSYLNLLKTGLHDVSCFKRNGSKYQSASFNFSLVSEKDFLAQGHSSDVYCLSFHPQGKSFISGSRDNTIKLWDMDTGECLSTFRGHSSVVYSVAFNPDGKSFISGSGDETIKLWDMDTGECLATFHEHSSAVTSVAFHPDGRTFVSGSGDNTVKIWDMATGECLTTCRSHSNAVYCLAIHPHGHVFISGYEDGTVKVWRTATGECLTTFRRHSRGIASVAFHKDGHTFVTGSWDNTIKVWDLTTGKCLTTFHERSSAVTSVAFHRDGQNLISGYDNGTVKVWNLDKSICLAIFRGNPGVVNSVAFHPHGHTFISGFDDGTVKVWNLASGESLTTFRGNASGITSLAFHPKTRSFISVSGDNTIKVWDMDAGMCLTTFRDHSSYIASVAFHKDGHALITASWDNTIKIWDMATGECLSTFRGHSSYFTSVAFHPDGLTFISGYKNGIIKIWNTVTGECMNSFRGSNSAVTSIAFHLDGQTLISGYNDGTVKVWNLATGEYLTTRYGHSSDVYCLSFHPQGKSFISGSRDNTIKLWDMDTGECLSTFRGHSSVVYSVAFNPDGKSFISGSGDETIKLWDMDTGECLATFHEHSSAVTSVAFHPDGRTFISASGGRTIKVWDLAFGKCQITIFNQLGIFLSGCTFLNLHHQSTFSNETKKILRRHGVLFNDMDMGHWQETMEKVLG